MDNLSIVWTDYMQYRLKLRGYNFMAVEKILRYSLERYVDTVTGRLLAIGKYERLLVMVPYELNGDILSPVTILFYKPTANQCSN